MKKHAATVMKENFCDAVFDGDLKRVIAMKEEGVDTACYNNWPIEIAARHGHLDIVKYLIDCGVDFRCHEERPLREAAEAGHLNIVKYFVSKGSDVNIRLKDLEYFARKNGHTHILSFLKLITNPKTKKLAELLYT